MFGYRKNVRRSTRSRTHWLSSGPGHCKRPSKRPSISGRTSFTVYPFNPASNPKFPMPPISIADPYLRSDGCGLVVENYLHVSAFHPIDAVICPACQLNQFNRGNGKCRRCHRPLGLAYIELLLPTPLACRNSQGLLSIREELGRFIRRMRSRRGMTQATLASATGDISRTYLSRLENGHVLPSVVALIEIAGVLGIDKITLRIRSSGA